MAAHASARTGIGADVLKADAAAGRGARDGRVEPSGGRFALGWGGAVQPGVLGMLAPLLDSNKDGSVADDVMGMFGKFLR